MVNSNNYHGLQALNSVEYKDNTKGPETNRSWAYKAGSLPRPAPPHPPKKKKNKKGFVR